MNTRDIMKALLEGKKVGINDTCYLYLNIDGELQVEKDTHYGPWFYTDVIGCLLLSDKCKVIPEEVEGDNL